MRYEYDREPVERPAPYFLLTPTQKLLCVYHPYSTTTMYSSLAAL